MPKARTRFLAGDNEFFENEGGVEVGGPPIRTHALQAAGRTQQRLPDAEPKSSQQHVSQPPQPLEPGCSPDTECKHIA